MSDLETIKAMLTRAKAEFSNRENWIKVKAGYAGFVSVFTFNEKGELLSLEAYANDPGD